MPAKRRRINRTANATASIEILETRQLLSAETPVIHNNGLTYPINREPLASNQVMFGGLTLTVGMFRDGTYYRELSDCEYWFDDLTTDESGVLRGTSSRSYFTIDASVTRSLIGGHSYRVFVREVNGPGGSTSVWSVGTRIVIGHVPEVLPIATGVSAGANESLFSGSELPIPVGSAIVPHTFVPAQPWDGISVRPLPGFGPRAQDYYVGSYEIELYAAGSNELLLTASHTADEWDGAPDAFTIETTTIDRLEHGEYSIRVRARYSVTGDPNVTASDWSDFQTFTLHAAPVDIVAGIGDTADATPTVNWTPVEGVASYEIWVSRRGEGQPVYRQTGLSGSFHRIAPTLPRGEYTVWVRAHFADGTRSVWGDGSPLNVGARANLFEARNGSVTWTGVPMSTRYELWIDYLGGESSPQQRFVHTANHFATSFTLSQDAPAGSYRAWVRAIRSEAGEHYLGFWSTPLDITLANTETPSHRLDVLLTSVSRFDFESDGARHQAVSKGRRPFQGESDPLTHDAHIGREPDAAPKWESPRPEPTGALDHVFTNFDSIWGSERTSFRL